MKRFFDRLWHKTLGQPYRLAVYDTGGNGEPLVLLHGLAQSGKKWKPLIKKLDGRKWRIVAPDLLGFGASPKPDWNSYTVQEHARMVLAALKRTGATAHRMTLVGHSMGCLVATHIAATHPSLVKRLVLFEPPLFANNPAYRRHARSRSRYFALYEYIASHPHLAFLHNRLLWRTARRITGLHLSEEEWTPFARSLRRTVMGQAAYDELYGIITPTDIIRGRLDMIVTRAELQKMFAHNANITMHAVNDVHDISPRSVAYIVKLLQR